MSRPKHDTHCAIRASAGTGKTFALTNRYIGLLAEGISPANIVATTFSRKAAGEIFQRVVRRLADAVFDAKRLGELREHVSGTLSADRCAELLYDFVRQTHRVNIATLDAMFIRIATTFSLDLHLPPGWTIGEGVDDMKLREDAIAAMLEASPPQRLIDLLRLLNKGEGSSSVTRQIDQAVVAMHRLYLDAPLESQWGWLSKPDEPDWGAWGSLLEAVAQMPMPLTKAGEPKKNWLNSREQMITAMNRRDWQGLLDVSLVSKVIGGEAKFDRSDIEPAVVGVVEAVLRVARAMLLRQLAGQNEATWALLEAFDGHHLHLRRQRRLLSFDDITRTLAVANLAGRLDAVYYRLDGRWHHLLLDEFQDTSLQQWRVVQPIARELTDQAAELGRSVFIVGDMKQAIYGWRGGNAEIFRQISDELPGLGEAGTLDKSWRSSPVVMDLTNAVFADIANNRAVEKWHAAAEQWADGFVSHSTHRTELPGYAALSVDVDPAAAATRLVIAQHAARPDMSIGVLVRTNKAVADIIYRLRAAGVFASEEGGNPLTDSPAVSVVLSLLSLADHPGDTAARFHVQHSPLGPMVGLTAKTAITPFAAALRRQLMADGYGPTVFDWARRFATACDRRNITRLMQLVELAYAHDARPGVRVSEFVQVVHETRVEDPSAANVRVMTVHQAKGLEFDVAVLPELEGQVIGYAPVALTDRPTPLAEVQRVSRYAREALRGWVDDLAAMYEQHAAARLNDSLSMLYVAITRAVHAVHMIVKPVKSIGTTYSGVIRAALVGEAECVPDDEGKPLWEMGDRNWADKTPAKSTAAAASTPDTPQEKPVTLPPLLVKPRRRLLVRQSPSDFEGGDAARLADRLRIHAGGAMTRGTIMHRWCEMIGWTEEGLPNDATLIAEARRINPAVEDVDALIGQWRAMMQQGEIAGVFARAGYDATMALAVERERRFAVRDETTGAILTGAIDRMVVGRMDDRIAMIDVIDFKTDRGDADRIAEHYRPQVRAYRRAVAKMYRVDEALITTRLALLQCGRVVVV